MLTSLLPLFIGPAVLLPIAAYAVLHRRVRAAGWYALLLVAIAHWSMTYAWELTAGELAFKILVLKIKYLGVCALPAIWIGFVLDFVGTEPGRIRRATRVVGTCSALLLALAWTDGWHHGFWGPISVDRSGPFDLLIGRGPGFYVNIFFTYAVLWAGVGVLATRAFQSPFLYAKRCGIVIAATLLPWLGNLAFLMEADTVAHIDPTPFLFACTGVGAVVAAPLRAREGPRLHRHALLPQGGLHPLLADRLQGPRRRLPVPRDERRARAADREGRNPRRARGRRLPQRHALDLGRRPRQGHGRHDHGRRARTRRGLTATRGGKPPVSPRGPTVSPTPPSDIFRPRRQGAAVVVRPSRNEAVVLRRAVAAAPASRSRRRRTGLPLE